MQHYRYLIIGGGMAAAAALAGIREVDAAGSIGLLSMESHAPYDRPPLSKKLWQDGGAVAQIMRKIPEGVDMHLGRTVQELDLAAKQVTDTQGEVYAYDKLLLATGSTPRKLPFGDDHIIYYRTLDDYQRLRALTEANDKFVVIGGGFIGSEIAAALAMQGKKVTMVFPERGLCHRIFPPELVGYMNQYYCDHGVELLSGENVCGVVGSGQYLSVLTEKGRRIEANGVIAGIGVQPNVALATAAGLEVDNGIVVNATLQTSHADVYAAGDVANFYDCVLSVHRRVEHEENANKMGKAAGRAMAGDTTPYAGSPMFYSDMFDQGYEAVGELDSRLETLVDWQDPYQKGVVYYLKNQHVRGVLLWNVWGKVKEARALIAAGETVTHTALRGRIA